MPEPEDVTSCRISFVETNGKRDSKYFGAGAKNVSKANDFYRKKQYSKDVRSGTYQVKVNGRWQLVSKFEHNKP